MTYSNRIVEAFASAYRAHGGQSRKGSGTPYIAHVLAVAAIVAEHGADEDVFIAALLHDAAEDAGGEETLTALRRQFGDRVADLVAACSDTFETPKPAWRPRKERFIDVIRDASPDVKLIVAADKLHNVSATVIDFARLGPAVWDRFNGGRDGTVWYYTAVAQALAHQWDHPILDHLTAAVEDLHKAVT